MVSEGIQEAQGVSHGETCARRAPSNGDSLCQGPEVGLGLAGLRSRKGSSEGERVGDGAVWRAPFLMGCLLE